MNTKKITFVAAMTLAGFACDGSVEGNGDVVEESRPVNSSIHTIVVKNAVDLTINQGQANVQVRADSNLLEYIETTQKDGVLTLQLKPGTSVRNGTLEAFVTTENLEQIRVSGASHVGIDYKSEGNMKARLTGGSDLTGSLQAVDMELDVSGPSEVKLKSNIESIALHAHGASKVDLSGAAKKITLDVSGASKINLLQSQIDHVDAQTISEASLVKFPALRTLKLKRVSDASKVTYKGEPAVTLGSITGASTVKRKN